MTPQLSIILPVHNARPYLGECLRSLAPQLEDRRIELIVVDDGSTDGSAGIAEAFARGMREGSVRLIRQENRGQGHARNRALAMARGEYVGFVDADDRTEEGMFPVMLDAALRLGADMVVCDYYIFDGSGRKRTVRYLDTRREAVDPAVVKSAVFATGFSLWNRIVRRELFAEADAAFPEGMAFEDLAVVPRLVARCRRLVNVSQVLYGYRVHPDSTVHSAGKHRDVFRALRLLIGKMPPAFAGETAFIVVQELAFYALPRYRARLDARQWKAFHGAVRSFVRQCCPDWRKNPYVAKAGIARRLYLSLLLGAGLRWPVLLGRRLTGAGG